MKSATPVSPAAAYRSATAGRMASQPVSPAAAAFISQSASSISSCLSAVNWEMDMSMETTVCVRVCVVDVIVGDGGQVEAHAC